MTAADYKHLSARSARRGLLGDEPTYGTDCHSPLRHTQYRRGLRNPPVWGRTPEVSVGFKVLVLTSG
jgi:hypothetical protein